MKQRTRFGRNLDVRRPSREAILLTPRLQAGDQEAGVNSKPFLTVSPTHEKPLETVRDPLLYLDQRAEAAVLMRSLRDVCEVARNPAVRSYRLQESGWL
jgi:hypothetical protein